MKLSQYTPQVGLNTIQGRVRTADNPAAYGGDQSGNAALYGGIAAGLSVYAELRQKDANDRVIDAGNEYVQMMNSALYDETNGIYYTYKGKDAAMAQQAMADASNKAKAKLAEKYKLNDEYTRLAFYRQIDATDRSNSLTMDKFQREEMVSYGNNQVAIALSNASDQIIRDPSSMKESMETFRRTYAATAAGLGVPEDEQQIYLKKSTNEVAQHALQAMTDNGDYENAANAIAYFRNEGADEGILSRFAGAVSGQKMAAGAQDIVGDAFLADPSFYNMTPDQAADAIIAKNPWKGYQGIAMGNPEWDRFDKDFKDAFKEYGITDPEQQKRIKAMAMQESSFNPDAVSGDGYDGEGIFQFDADTAQSVGLAPEDRKDARKNIFAGVALAAKRLKKYDGDMELTMLAHNGGEGGIEAARANHYVENVDEKYNMLYGRTLSPEEERTQQDAYRAQIRAAVVKKQAEYRALGENTMNNIGIHVSQMAEGNASTWDRYQYVVGQLGIHPELENNGRYWALRASLKDTFDAETTGKSKGTGGAGKMSAEEKAQWKSIIGAGDIRKKDELDQHIKDSGTVMSLEQYDDLLKCLNDRIAGTGEFETDIYATKKEIAEQMGISADAIPDSEWNMDKYLTRQWAVLFHDKQGRWPNQNEINGTLQTMLMDNIGLGDGTNISKVDEMRMGVTDIEDTDDPKYKRIFYGRRSYDVHVSQLQKLRDGELKEKDLEEIRYGNR